MNRQRIHLYVTLLIVTPNSDMYSDGSRIFPRGVRQFPIWDYFVNFFAENFMKMKEFGPRGAPPLDPPMMYQFIIIRPRFYDKTCE